MNCHRTPGVNQHAIFIDLHITQLRHKLCHWVIQVEFALLIQYQRAN